MDKTLNRLCRVVGQSAIGIALTWGSHALAVEPRIYQLGDGGAVSPHLKLEFGSDNNVLRQSDGSDSSAYFRLEPSLRYLVQQRNNRLAFGYKGDYYQFAEDYCLVPRDAECPNGDPQYDKASYQDHMFSVEGFLEISRRARVTLDLEQALLHQATGTGLSANAGFLRSLREPVSFRRTLARAELSYGAPLARGELRFALSLNDKQFDNSDNLSERSLIPSATLLYRVGTKTQFLAGFAAGEVTGGNSEREITRQFVGVEFDASAITSGSFLLTNVVEDFSGSRGDLGYLGWELAISWKPRRFSTVTISGSRETSRGLFNLDSDTVATVDGPDLGLTSIVDIDWRHSWKERFSTDVGLTWQQNRGLDNQAEGILGRDFSDLTTTLRIEGNYSLRRWLDVGAFVVNDLRDGNSDDRDYGRSVVGLTLNGTI